MKLSEIYEGWRNKLLPPENLKELINSTAEERINICLSCPHHSKNHKSRRPDDHCTKCGCTLSAKTKCLSCSCPLEKWLATATGEEEEQLKKDLYGEESSET